MSRPPPLGALSLKRLKRPLISGLRVAGAAALLVAAMAPSLGEQAAPVPAAAPTSAPAEPAAGVLILIRSTLLALAHANATGNYTVLRDLGAPGFQAVNSAARLSEIFSSLRAQRLDLSQLAVLEPQLSNPPQLDAKGLLRIDGIYPSTAPQIAFSLVFEPVAGQWRLFGISVNPSQPVSVSAPATPAAPPATNASPTGIAEAQHHPAVTPAPSKSGVNPPKR